MQLELKMLFSLGLCVCGEQRVPHGQHELRTRLPKVLEDMGNALGARDAGNNRSGINKKHNAYP